MIPRRRAIYLSFLYFGDAWKMWCKGTKFRSLLALFEYFTPVPPYKYCVSTFNTLDHAASLLSSFSVIVLISLNVYLAHAISLLSKFVLPVNREVVSIIMTSSDITHSHHVTHDVSESSPLLQNSTEVAVDVFVPAETPQLISLRLKRRIVLLLCAFAFTMMLGDNLQPAALIQIFEDVICDDYYRTHPLYPASNTTTPPTLPLRLADQCKAQAVQKELALVRGFQQLVPLFAGLLCTVPYGLLAERIGRKRVLILSGAGVFAALSWVLAVCYWRFASIRWVWSSGAFLFIGGGDAVTSSVMHVMVTDAADQAERAQIFLYLHAADAISGFFGPAISAALMEKGYTWTVLLLAESVLFSGTFLLTRFIPETLNLRDKSSGSLGPTYDPTSPRVTVSSSRCSSSSIPTKRANSMAAGISSLLAPLLSVLTSNRQALLLLCISALRQPPESSSL